MEEFHNAGRPPQPYLLLVVLGSLETIEHNTGSACPFAVFFGSFCCAVYCLSGSATIRASTMPIQQIAVWNLLLSTRDISSAGSSPTDVLCPDYDSAYPL